MHLTLHSDYALRVLIYLAIEPSGKATIGAIADSYGIARNHLIKVANRLASLGYLEATRGRGGGLKLAQAPERIRLGEVVRYTEPNFYLVECFNPEANHCLITSACGLRGILAEARNSFLEVLDHYTLADAVKQRSQLVRLISARSATKHEQRQYEENR